jgi:hypothetical protein
MLKKAVEPLTPKQISAETGIKHNTVKVYVRQLLIQKLISQPYPRAYSYNNHPRGEEPPPRVHNVVLNVLAPWLSSPVEEIRERIGEIGFRVIFSVKRKKVTCVISRDAGMDYSEFALAVELFRLHFVIRTSHMIDSNMIRVQTCELLEDYSQLRLEGVKCVTVRSYLGALERVYNKKHGLRSEVKVQPQNAQTIMTLLKGSVPSYDILERQFMIEKEFQRFTDALKGQNLLTSRLTIMLKELLKRKLKEPF